MTVRIIVLFIGLFLSGMVFSQKITVSGEVCGLGMQDVKLLKKLKKNISYEGTLEKVKVNLKASGFSKTIYTKLDGEFNFTLPRPNKYYLTISKAEYPTVTIGLDLKQAGRYPVNIDDLNFLLEKGDENKYSFGVIAYKNKKFYHAGTKSGSATNVEEVNFLMLDKAATINTYKHKEDIKSWRKSQNAQKDVEVENIDEGQNAEPDVIVNKIDETIIAVSDKLSQVISINDSTDALDTANLVNVIAEAKAALKNLEVDSKEYKRLQKDIILAESKLNDAKKIIALKDSEIAQHKKVILYSILFSISLLIILGLVVYFMRELNAKKKDIAKKNAKIMSSLDYASLIQNALLNTKNGLTEYFSDSFIYYKPKEIVSGDFYWFKKVGDKVVAIASDCTGHGVPGALLTMLGMSALERIVGENKKVDPVEILKELDKDVSVNLEDNNPFQLNGMDISVVVFDTAKSTLSYIGAMREIAIAKKSGEINFIEPEKASIASGRLKFEEHHKDISISKDDTVFLFSDGYQDQFKGGNDTSNIETYNYNRFKELLIRLAKKSKISDAEVELEEDLKAWKGEKPQTDDVMVVGIRV